jgi:regulatory protein
MTGPAAERGRAGRVSAVVPDPRHPGSVRVQVDGRTLLTVREEVLRPLGIDVGVPLEADTVVALGREADAEGAYRALLQMLGRRPFAARDMARRLVLRGIPPEAADRAVARALAAGLLDDEAFARHYVQSRSARGRGPARLRRDLAALGVAARLIDRVLAEEVPDGASPERVYELARQRAGQLPPLPARDRVRRVLSWLARRGHTGPEVRRIARRALEEG